MLRYLISRLLWAVVLFLAVTFVTYVIFFLMPAEPGATRRGPVRDAGEGARGARSSTG